MISVKNIGESFVVQTDTLQIAIPKGKAIFTSSKKSTAVNIKLLGSRKTIISINSKDLGYDNAEDAIKYLNSFN